MIAFLLYGALLLLLASHALNGARHLIARTDFCGRPAPWWFKVLALSEFGLALWLGWFITALRVTAA